MHHNSSSSHDACLRCGKVVYAMEGIVFNRRHWHKSCFRCSECSKTLSLSSVHTIAGEPLCAKHHQLQSKRSNSSTLRPSPSLASVSATSTIKPGAEVSTVYSLGINNQRLRAFTAATAAVSPHLSHRSADALNKTRPQVLTEFSTGSPERAISSPCVASVESASVLSADDDVSSKDHLQAVDPIPSVAVGTNSTPNLTQSFKNLEVEVAACRDDGYLHDVDVSTIADDASGPSPAPKLSTASMSKRISTRSARNEGCKSADEAADTARVQSAANDNLANDDEPSCYVTTTSQTVFLSFIPNDHEKPEETASSAACLSDSKKDRDPSQHGEQIQDSHPEQKEKEKELYLKTDHDPQNVKKEMEYEPAAALESLATEVKGHGDELCKLYESIVSTKRFNVELIQLIFGSVMDGANRVLMLASPVVSVQRLSDILNSVERRFLAKKNNAEPDSHMSANVLREAVDEIIKAIDYTISDYKLAINLIFVKDCREFCLEALGKASEVSYAAYKMEHVENDASWFRQYFMSHEHRVIAGESSANGAVIISLKKEDLSTSITPKGETPHQEEAQCQYRVILRWRESGDKRLVVTDASIPSQSLLRGKPNSKAIIAHVDSMISIIKTRKSGTIPNLQSSFLALDELNLSKKYKVGVLLCREGQTREEEFFGNESATTNFSNFLHVIGDPIELKGFPGYLGGLDNRNGNTGEESFHTVARGEFEIMYHVSTCLPFDRSDTQQIQRKRHIGNDIVCIVFLDGDSVFDPTSVKSQFLHVFIIVKEVRIGVPPKPGYQVCISRRVGVPFFGPPLPSPPIFYDKSTLRDFLLAKVVNGEHAALKSERLHKPQERTRIAIFDQLYSDVLQDTNSSKPTERLSPTNLMLATRRPSDRGSAKASSHDISTLRTEEPTTNLKRARSVGGIKVAPEPLFIQIGQSTSSTQLSPKVETTAADGGDPVPPSPNKFFASIRRASHSIFKK